MKIFKLIISMMMIGLFFIGVCTAEEEKKTVEYREFIDIISEWTPYANAIQIGDVYIYEFDSVWIDNGGAKLIFAGKGDIKMGKVARVILKTEDGRNRWSASKIILYSGKALENLVDSLPGNMKKEYLIKN